MGEQERHQLYTLNPSHLSGSGTLLGPESTTRRLSPPTYDATVLPPIGIRGSNTTTQALVNDPTTSPTQQVPITNVIQPVSPSGKYTKPRIGGIASLAEPSLTSPGATVIPMTPR